MGGERQGALMYVEVALRGVARKRASAVADAQRHGHRLQKQTGRVAGDTSCDISCKAMTNKTLYPEAAQTEHF